MSYLSALVALFGLPTLILVLRAFWMLRRSRQYKDSDSVAVQDYWRWRWRAAACAAVLVPIHAAIMMVVPTYLPAVMVVGIIEFICIGYFFEQKIQKLRDEAYPSLLDKFANS